MYSNDFIRFQENKFDSFCRTVIKNARSDNLRMKKRREDRFSSLEELPDPDHPPVSTEDTYRPYVRIYRVKGIDIPISDERIGEVVQYILPNQRAVLLLSYFKEYTDMEISRFLGISHKTVAYRKKLAIRKMRLLLEAYDRAKEEN